MSKEEKITLDYIQENKGWIEHWIYQKIGNVRKKTLWKRYNEEEYYERI